ncbi:MAG: ribonuclease III [Clostridia bacterium]|nr:ribonuclease III [Clostridia bacterium]
MIIFDIDGVENIIGYSFKDKMLLRKCFTHSSYANEHGEKDNERLEFFGDSIMEFVVTEYLFKKCKGDEGLMTKERAEMVSKTPLLEAIYKLGLDEYVLLGHGQEKSVSHDDKLFSSVYEAIVAGMYLDGGLVPVKKFITNTIIKNYEEKQKNKAKPNAKGAIYKVELQEYVQKRKMGSITYQTLSKNGPDHNPVFREAVLLNGKNLAEGQGRSKQIAQNQAASKALETIKRQGR